MALTLTSTNAVIMITIPGVFTTPQQLQGFAADDIFGTDEITPTEVSMGVDGILSGGYTPVPIKQNYMLQANSASKALFDNWFNAMVAAQETYQAAGVITLRSLQAKWALVNGFLTGYKPIPDAGKILKPLSFAITWQQVTPAPN